MDTDRDLLRICLDALNDIPRKAFRLWYVEKYGFADTYALAARIEAHFRGESAKI